MPDLIAGRVQVNFGPVGGAVAHANEGRIRMLATLLPQRTALTPDVPTMTEAGLPGVSVWSYQMILAPAKTPPAAIERLARDLGVALQDAEVRTQLAKLALTVEPATPEQLAA
jgi:tripartite-type tricarboxylate transporter receptor subunit TctC